MVHDLEFKILLDTQLDIHNHNVKIKALDSTIIQVKDRKQSQGVRAMALRVKTVLIYR